MRSGIGHATRGGYHRKGTEGAAKSPEKETPPGSALRNEAIEKFARGHQPSEISTPSFVNDFCISNVICAGDNITGNVMLRFDITPLYGGFRLYMGGERNGTAAFAKGAAYPSSDHYGRVYTMRGGQPEHVVVMFYNIAPGIDTLDRVDISMGLALNTLNIITMRNVPIFWTYTDKAIRNFVREKSAKGNANQNQNTNLK